MTGLIGVCVLWSGSSFASIELDELHCGEFLHMKWSMLNNDALEAVQLTDTWLYGFAVAQRRSTSMNPDQFYQFTSDMTDRCSRSSDSLLLDILRETPFRSD